MTSRDRIIAALNGEPADHTPLTTWCFGFPAPDEFRWSNGRGSIDYWYTNRLEHLHCLPKPWTLEDDFRRAQAWLAMGIDDALEVSVPWSMEDCVTFSDSVLPPGHEHGDERYPVLVREYETPSGKMRHAVRQTDNEGTGWPIQPDCVPIIEDYNIPRAVHHAVSRPEDVAAVKHVFAPPDDDQKAWFDDRMKRVKAFADEKGLFTQAWSAFGMDAAIWFMGTQNAIMMAMDAPEAFEDLMQSIADTDLARTEIAAKNDGVDMVCQRGWYSSTDFWSPALFDRFVFPHIKAAADVAHKHGKKFGYVMTTGVERLGERLIDAGVDLLFFVDPLLDDMSPEKAAEMFGDKMTMVGGINSQTLHEDADVIRETVREAMTHLAPTNRFILHPMDAIFPDTPQEGLRVMIDTWKEFH
ncbi:MAG: hypothetical protein JXM70_08290 [Pirellulales bacterium]|nr:hypothetical protein [Pirellulales bacterium]